MIKKPVLFSVEWASKTRMGDLISADPCYAIIEPVGSYNIAQLVILFDEPGSNVLSLEAPSIASYIIRKRKFNPGMVTWYEFSLVTPRIGGDPYPVINQTVFSWKWGEKRWRADDQDWIDLDLSTASEVAGFDIYAAAKAVLETGGQYCAATI